MIKQGPGPPQRIYKMIWRTFLSQTAETVTHTQVEDGDYLLPTSMEPLSWLKPEGWWIRLWKHHPVTSPSTNQKSTSWSCTLLLSPGCKQEKQHLSWHKRSHFDLSLGTMLVLEWSSVISDLKGIKECRNTQLLSGRRSNSSKDNLSVVNTPS